MDQTVDESGEVPATSPPPSERHEEQPVDEPRARLIELAGSLIRRRDPRQLVEYLRLRRCLRG